MNATKFVVLLFIGVACANVCARQLEAVSQETKPVISIPETTNRIGAALSVYIGTTIHGPGGATAYVSALGGARSSAGGGSVP
ncbi:hypothetical protein HA466_0017950 [Hirschfeldia incana]|nr:hypothetical protein HA466_0017950 [Hirschfeldia incana]